MKLCVLTGGESLDETESLVRKLFSVIPCRTWCSSAKRENSNDPTFSCYHENVNRECFHFF